MEDENKVTEVTESEKNDSLKKDKKKPFLSVKDIAFNAIIAAIYVVFTIFLGDFAYGQIQFRIAEILGLLCFFRKDSIVGVTLGCLIANIASTVGPVDMIFGTLATLIACIGIAFCKHLLVAAFIPVVVNGFVIGAELYFFLELPFWINVLWVSLGELVVLAVGYGFFMLHKKSKNMRKIVGAKQNIDFKF